MQNKFTKLLLAGVFGTTLALPAFGDGHSYGPFPITLKGYSGDKTNSVSYSGQIARHVQHDSLKKLAGSGNLAEMMAYFKGSDKNKKIHAPASKGDFIIKQTLLNEISSGKNLSGKSYKGLVNGWPGGMTGVEVLEHMINKAAEHGSAFDPNTGYNYPQLISKFAMGAVFYNQAVDNYLDEKLGPDNKPNNKPYKDGAYYTGKEHSWDEAFGYWGAAAHSLNLTAEQNYNITKMKDMAAADHNGDGVVDLKTEYNFAHAYYAASYDKGGKTDYFKTVTQAFVDGRKIITAANGEALTNAQRSQLYVLRDIIGQNWEKVIAESVFKYAGSVYKDIDKLQTIMEANGDTTKAFATYGKHWGELKGFLMALETSGQDLGEAGIRMNRLVGYGPVLLGGGQVIGIDNKGGFITGGDRSMGEYQVHMIKLQKILGDKFDLKARKNDVTGQMDGLLESLGSSRSAEND